MISSFVLVTLKGKKSNKKIAMLSETNDHHQWTHKLCHFCGQFPTSACLYTFFSEHLCVFTNCLRCPLTDDGHPGCRTGYPMPWSGSQSLSKRTGRTGEGPLRSSFIRATRSVIEIPTQNRVGRARTHFLSSSLSKTPVIFIIARSRCLDWMHKPGILLLQSRW